MRVALACTSDPWRTTDGGTLRSRAFAEGIAEDGHAVVVLFPSTLPPASAPDGITSRAVPVLPPGMRAWPAWVRSLKRTLLPLPTLLGGRSDWLAGALADAGPVDLVVANQLPIGQQAIRGATHPVWLDFSDLFSDFATSEASIRTGVARWTATRQSHRLARQERDLASRATVITTAGWSDGEALQATSGRSVTWIPTPVAPPIPTSSTSPRDDPPVAGFLANFEYWPNRDALDVLVGTWAPRLVAIGWRVLVAGRGSDALALPDGVDNLGPVPSIDDFYRRVDATVAPIRIGGGMKVKVIESLVHGTPVIATAHAVEGFPPEIQRLAVTVDVDEPDFETVRHGPPPAPVLSPDLYEPFSTAGFRRRVSLALEDVTGR